MDPALRRFFYGLAILLIVSLVGQGLITWSNVKLLDQRVQNNEARIEQDGVFIRALQTTQSRVITLLEIQRRVSQ